MADFREQAGDVKPEGSSFYAENRLLQVLGAIAIAGIVLGTCVLFFRYRAELRLVDLVLLPLSAAAVWFCYRMARYAAWDEGDTLVVRNHFRTYRMSRAEIAGFTVGVHGRGQFVRIEFVDGRRRVWIDASGSPPPFGNKPRRLAAELHTWHVDAPV